MSSITASSIASSLAAERLFVANPGLSGDLGITQALLSLRGQPGTVLLLDRAYVCSHPIVLQPGQCLRSLGAATLRCAAALDPATPFLSLAGGCSLANLTIVRAGEAKGPGIRFEPASMHGVCRDCIVRGFDYGVALANCYCLQFHNCRVEGCDVGVQYSDKWVMDSSWLGGHIAGNRIGVRVVGAGHFGHTFALCIEGNREGGISIEGSMSSVLVQRCYFEQNGPFDVRLNDGNADGWAFQSNLFVAGLQSATGLSSRAGIVLGACVNAVVAHNFFGIEHPLQIVSGAQQTHVYPNRWRVRPTVSELSGGWDTRYHEGSSAIPLYWATPDAQPSL